MVPKVFEPLQFYSSMFQGEAEPSATKIKPQKIKPAYDNVYSGCALPIEPLAGGSVNLGGREKKIFPIIGDF